MTKITITIHGTLRGPIWWPVGQDMEKRFVYTVSKDETLREAILKITNDSDFQSCDILADSFVKAVMYRPTRVITRYFDLLSPLFPSIQDCILDDYPLHEI